MKIDGKDLRDDTVFIAENKEDLRQLLDIIDKESSKKGLELNSKKAEGMAISRNNEFPQINIFIHFNIYSSKGINSNNVLRYISSDGRNNTKMDQE